MSAYVKHTKDHTSYCVLQNFCKVSAGGVPIVNEMDCPLLQATDRLCSSFCEFAGSNNQEKL